MYSLILTFVAIIGVVFAAPPTSSDEAVTEIILKNGQEVETPEVQTRARYEQALRDDSFLTVYLDIGEGCHAVYDQLIRQLENCKNGVDHGDPSIFTGCLLKVALNNRRCEQKPNYVNSVIYFPPVEKVTQWHPTPPCNGEYCEGEPGPVWSGGVTKSNNNNNGGNNNYNDNDGIIRSSHTQGTPQVDHDGSDVDGDQVIPPVVTESSIQPNIIGDLLKLIQN